MKPAFFALTALGALAAAAPALAQGYGSGYQGNNDRYYNNYSTNRSYYDDDRAEANLSVATRIGRLETRLNAGMRAGTIDRDEAMRLRAELRDLRRMNSQYGYGGVNASERSDLMARLQGVREDLRAAEQGTTRYGSGYGSTYGSGTYGNSGYGSTYGNGYGTNGYGTNGYGSTYSNGYGTNGYGSTYSNGYGTNGYGTAYGRNGYAGQGGPYEEVETCDNRTGVIGGLIDSVVGRDCTTTMVRVGQRAPSNLYGVPYEMQSQYRDGYGYYYRSDGRSVYQIDSRTNTVLRVYPMNR